MQHKPCLEKQKKNEREREEERENKILNIPLEFSFYVGHIDIDL